MDKFEKELKKEFQLERMILFSDAVFAIAITLMVIEIKIPHIEGIINDDAISDSLIHLLPVFFGFIISFFVIGNYWTVHHRIFGYLINYDNKLIWLNLFFLLSIVTMPFTSGLYGTYWQGNLMLPFIIYTINIWFTCLCNALIISHISRPEKGLSIGLSDRNMVRLLFSRAWMMAILFTIGILISYLTFPWVGRMSPALYPLYSWLVIKRFARKVKALEKHS